LWVTRLKEHNRKLTAISQGYAKKKRIGTGRISKSNLVNLSLSFASLGAENSTQKGFPRLSEPGIQVINNNSRFKNFIFFKASSLQKAGSFGNLKNSQKGFSPLSELAILVINNNSCFKNFIFFKASSLQKAGSFGNLKNFVPLVSNISLNLLPLYKHLEL
jgi:hypothetical protein